MILKNAEGDDLISNETGVVIVQETRARLPFRSLPREFSDRILGNKKEGILPMKLDVQYQEFRGQSIVSVRCWKCPRIVIGYQPVYSRSRDGNKNMADATTVNINGKNMVVGSLLPYSHYREGIFNSKLKDGRMQSFSYIHCADCGFKDEDGPDILACHLGGLDVANETMRNESTDDDAWAQSMFRWSGVELIGKAGASLSPADMIGLELKKSKDHTVVNTTRGE